MADININFGTEDLESLKKLMNDILKAMEAIKKVVADSGNITAQHDVEAKKLQAQLLKVSNEYQKQQTIQNKNKENLQTQTGIIGGLEKQVKDLTKAWKSATDAASKDTARNNLDAIKKKLEEAKGSTNTWGKALDSFQFKFNALGNIAANVLSSIKRGAQEFIRDAIQMAAQTEGVRQAFNNLNKASLLGELRKATRGAVSDLSLMKSAVMAENFKIPLTQLATFLKFAGDRALSTGQDFDYLVESIIRGLGRESVLVLDNLGLSAKELQDEAKKTGSFFEGAATVISREMAAAGEVLDTTATQFARFNAAVANLKVETGKNLAPAIGGAADKLSQFIQKLNESEISLFQVLIPSLLFTKAQSDLISGTDDLNVSTENIVKTLLSQTVVIKELSEDYKGLDEALESLNEQIYKGFQEAIEAQDKESKKNLEDRLRDIEKRKEMEAKGAKEITDILLDLQTESDKIFSEIGIENDKKANDDFIKNLEAKNKAEIDAEDEKERAKQEIIQASMQVITALSDLRFSRNQAKMDAELAKEGLTEEQKLQIRKKYARKEQNIAVSEAVMGAAQGIVAIWAKWAANPVVAGILTGIEATATGLQIAAIKAQKFAKGGLIGGKSHEQGGTIIEAERGEFVVKKSAYQKNKQLVNAINAEDSYKIAIAMRQDKGRQRVEKDYTKELLDYIKKQPVYGETKEFYVIHEGNRVTKIHKD